MKRMIGLLAFGAMLSVTGAALAAEVTSTVKAVDTQTRRVTLEDGKVYTYIGSQAATVGKLKAGDKIKVVFNPATPVFVSLGIHGSATKIEQIN
jgi:Cu/Ag efflux protein CusF